EHYDKMIKLKGETGITFAFGVGNGTCPNPIVFAAAEKELERYHLGWYRARQVFDRSYHVKRFQKPIRSVLD
ncbi:hypothetical protein, partial [Enterobacter hormaechei]|uniref:hypothetical protein n=1 Tax=Enterobacter hormaechei TaxID=158836 RepID=UPI0023E35AAE